MSETSAGGRTLWAEEGAELATCLAAPGAPEPPSESTHRAGGAGASARCPAGLRGGSSHREITHPTEQLFLSPAKAPLHRLNPLGAFLGGRSEPGEEKLGPVQSLAAASSPSQTAEESPFPLTNLPGGHRTGLRADWEMLGRRSTRESGAGGGWGVSSTPEIPREPPDPAGSRGGSALPSPGGGPAPLLRQSYKPPS